MSDPNNPNIQSRNMPQWALYQRELFWKDNMGEVPPFSTEPGDLEDLAKRTRQVLYLLECRTILYTPCKPTSLLPPPNNPSHARRRQQTRHKVSAPIGFSPIGINKIYHPLGKLPVAKAAKEKNLPYCLSTAGSTAVEDVRKANGAGPRFFQLYMPHDDELMISLLHRAHDSVFTAYILMLDTWQSAWRHHNEAESNYAFYHGISADLGLSDPVFQKRMKAAGIDPKTQPNEAGAMWIDNVWHGRAWSWDKTSWLTEQWKRISGGKPFCLKGIQSVADAQMSIEPGVDGIVVSNHAGRQVDGTVASLGALEKIVAAVGDKTYIMFDSGVRGAADVFKALALGAKFVLVGRLWIWGLSIEGELSISRDSIESLPNSAAMIAEKSKLKENVALLHTIAKLPLPPPASQIAMPTLIVGLPTSIVLINSLSRAKKDLAAAKLCQLPLAHMADRVPKAAELPIINHSKFVPYSLEKLADLDSNVRDRACDQIYPSQIDTTGLTHLNFAFLFIDPVSFRVVPVDPGDTSLYSQFTALKSTVMQTWISVGGSALSDLGPTQFTWSDMASTAANRAAFITSLCTFLEQYGFQGVDLDWETPTVSSRGGRPADLNNLVLLLKDMRTEFGTRYGISIALPPDYYDLSGFDAKALQPYLDFFNFMAYDIHGPWETPYLGAFVRPQASIVDIGTDTSPLWFDGVDPSKVNLGIPYYGRGYTLTNLTCTDVGCPYSGPNYAGQCSGSPGVLSLKEIDEIIEQRKLVPKKIPNAFQKQITFDNQWIGYDDKDTIHEKVRWGDEHCLGGTVVWSIDLAAGNGKPAPSAPLTIPVIPSPSVTPPEGPLKASIDGSCGQSATCLGSLFGDCCSKYGYCGHTSDYCSLDSGCQSYFGLCGDTPLVSPVAPVASPVSTSNPITALKPSVDGSCGKDATCLGSTFGPCCSSYGWCGSTSEYCLPSNGCQAGFGACTGSLATTASPSSSSSPTTISPVLSLTAPLKFLKLRQIRKFVHSFILLATG
ncbi:hypothetical protein G7Y89_g13544 [Cudoniella acicularis]|uniref:Chitinase n=1 Tax=Cudoniella acicularis TaxID=354080 RepID=A0A8H4VVY2_9HELO|nr:hypothetical protein G7Y89_g13544 [Cudoniella acicularis]